MQTPMGPRQVPVREEHWVMALDIRAGTGVTAGVAVVALKVGTSAPQLAGGAAVVAITWLVTLSFVVIGLMLLLTDVPAVNGRNCVLVAASTIPGDLNDPHWAGSALS